MYLSIIFLPILGSIISGFFGRKVGVSGAQLISTSSIIITTILCIVIFFEMGFNNMPIYIELFKWIDSESFNILLSFNFDSLTVSMLIPVLTVSCLVHVYSIGYMSHDPHNQRFFSYLSLFTFMMIILVTSNNFLLMFVGWEGVGICSYLLVSFWFTRIAANQSSISALLTNRVGDCFLTIGMFVLLWTFGNIDYSTIFSLSPFISENIIVTIGICLLIGAMAKSSQIGLHVWLPMAMEGPTPVSALIHAATMVTAGVYLLIRNSPLIEYSETLLVSCIWIGGITTVFSSLIGLFQQDIKKVIAYSTMSQLGMMVIAVGLSSYNIALFHLVNHAFYKALLFLGAGSVIHAVSDNQDFRKYGGLIKFLPLTYSVMLIASLSLVAFPFMTGFYSKDLIIESAYGNFLYSGITIYYIATIGAMFTTLYSVKVLYLTFVGNPLGSIINYKKAHESDIFMSIPLILLAIFSIFFGYIAKDIFIGLGSSFFIDNGLYIHPNHEIMVNTEFAVPLFFKMLPFILTIITTIMSILVFELGVGHVIVFKLTNIGYNIYSFFNQRFYIELFYNKFITNLILKMGGHTTKILDKGSIELVGPHGLEMSFNFISKIISTLDNKIITSYALYILVGLASYILIPNSTDNNLLILILFVLFTGLFNTNSSKYTSNDNYRDNVLVDINIHNGFTIKSFFTSVLVSLIIIVLFKGPFIVYNIVSQSKYYIFSAVLCMFSAVLAAIIRTELFNNKFLSLTKMLLTAVIALTIFLSIIYIKYIYNNYSIDAESMYWNNSIPLLAGTALGSSNTFFGGNVIRAVDKIINKSNISDITRLLNPIGPPPNGYIENINTLTSRSNGVHNKAHTCEVALETYLQVSEDQKLEFLKNNSHFRTAPYHINKLIRDERTAQACYRYAVEKQSTRHMAEYRSMLDSYKRALSASTNIRDIISQLRKK